MIVRFAIDPAVLSVAQNSAAAHFRLIQSWLAHRIGVLVDIKSEDGVGAFGASIDNIENQQIRSMWKKAYEQALKTYLLRFVRSEHSLDCYTPENVKTLAPHIDVFVIHGPDKGQYGGQLVDTNESSTIRQFTDNPMGKVELTGLGSFDVTNETINAFNLRQLGTIPHSTSIDSIWQERFHRMFHVSQDIHIVDRYICERHNYMDDRSGLARMIEMAKKHSNKLRNKKITIYAELPNQKELGMAKAIESVSNQIQNAIYAQDAMPNPFGHISIQFIPSSWFTNVFRDRYIRFASVGVIGGGHGSEIFEGKNYVTENFKSISWNSDILTCQKVEDRLSDGSDPVNPVVIVSSN